MDKAQQLGSQTAKEGFKNEKDIIAKFNNWQNDAEASQWLMIMGYDLREIESVKAISIAGHKRCTGTSNYQTQRSN